MNRTFLCKRNLSTFAKLQAAHRIKELKTVRVDQACSAYVDMLCSGMGVITTHKVIEKTCDAFFNDNWMGTGVWTTVTVGMCSIVVWCAQCSFKNGFDALDTNRQIRSLEVKIEESK